MKIKTYQSEEPPQGRVFIGVDPSLTGFAVCALDTVDNYAIQVFSPKSAGTQRLMDLRDAFAGFITEYEIADIAMEGGVVRSPSASVLGEISGVIKEYLLRQHHIIPASVPPMSLKKFVCGKASGVSKSQVMMSLLKRYKVEINDDNAADAYGIARIARGVAITVPESEVILRLQDRKYRV